MKTKSKEKIKASSESVENNEFIFIDKAVFFLKLGILAVGDLHIGYEHMLRRQVVGLPENQTEDIIQNIKDIMLRIKSKGHKIKKIIFLGDIKHYFSFDFGERKIFDKILEFLRQNLADRDIILLKGNHDKMDYSGKKMKNYYINNGICFTHGHMPFPQIFEEKVKTIVLGHIHPSVIISDKANIKREKFKCFLVGEFKGKKVIILPSFFNIIEGTSVNDYGEDYSKYMSILPKETVMNSTVFVIGKDKVYDFGKVRDLD